jgi:hypothetical protein
MSFKFYIDIFITRKTSEALRAGETQASGERRCYGDSTTQPASVTIMPRYIRNAAPLTLLVASLCSYVWAPLYVDDLQTTGCESLTSNIRPGQTNMEAIIIPTMIATTEMAAMIGAMAKTTGLWQQHQGQRRCNVILGLRMHTL